MNIVILSYERKEQHEVEDQIMVDVVLRFESWREEIGRYGSLN